MIDTKGVTKAKELGVVGRGLQLDADKLRAAYLRWVIYDDVTFRKATSDDFHNFLLHTNPWIEENSVLPSASTTPRGWIQHLYTRKKVDVKALLQQAITKINISFDIWTSRNHIPFLGIIGHFLHRTPKDDTMPIKVRRVLLGMPACYSSYTGDRIAEYMTTFFAGIGITNNLGIFMGDAAGNNGTAVDKLGELVDLKGRDSQAFCIGHILNNVAKAVYFGKGSSKFEKALETANPAQAQALWLNKGPIGKAHNLVTYILRSDARIQEFEGYILPGSPGHPIKKYKLLKDGGVRWLSMYYMTERVLLLRKALDTFTTVTLAREANRPESQRSNLRDCDRLTDSDWLEIGDFVKVLQTFHYQIKRLEGDAQAGQKGALWESLVTLNSCDKALSVHWQTRDDNPTMHLNPDLSHSFEKGMRAGRAKINKYLDKLRKSKSYCMASVLNPKLKYGYFDTRWNTQYTKGWAGDLKRVVKDYWQEWKEQHSNERIQSDSSDDEDAFEQEMNNERRSQRGDELEQYLREPRHEKILKDLFLYWYDLRNRWPLLSKLALDLHCCPAESAGNKREFSYSGKIVTTEREGLGEDIVEALSCTKSWLRDDFVTITPGDCHGLISTDKGHNTEQWQGQAAVAATAAKRKAEQEPVSEDDSDATEQRRYKRQRTYY